LVVPEGDDKGPRQVSYKFFADNLFFQRPKKAREQPLTRVEDKGSVKQF